MNIAIKKPFFKFIKTAKFQLTVIIIIIFYIISLLLWQNEKAFYAEKIFTINKLDENIKQISNPIKVGLSINNFPTFSFQENKFIMDAFVWFRYEIGTESLDTISDFTFKNTTKPDGGILHKSKPMVKLEGDEVVVTYHIQIEFKAPLVNKYFPIGDHRLNFILENRSVTPRELYFECDLENFVLSDNLFVSTWKPVQKMVQTGFWSAKLTEKKPPETIIYPCVVFTIDFENVSNRNLITLYFPMFVVFFIGLLSLIIDIKDTFRLGLIATSAPILVLFRMAIESLSPQVGAITKVDFIYFLLVSLSLAILLFQAYVIIKGRRIKKYNKEKQEKALTRLENLNNIFFILILLLLVILLTYDNIN